ncbi:MAG: UDP-N-acetylglucosamine diphosphorylase/glucosamine-phosphate N-acetyltransferase [Bacillales bacterium]|jgi:bifunctional UDP-N-acetylglucosamine pyrophosphorylase/glucosamine-1-phosphate N-acetyltransferase|nr:UDP-N-acetylglucosamine diphosphorylase/glucosamine-phosphate N-acetyltransferase [Bacillales bacterium]
MKKYSVVLAAGQGTRMKSSLYKVLHQVCGKSMVEHVVDHLSTLDIEKTVTIVGHGADAVRNVLGERSHYALQEKQLGTGHAVMQAESILGGCVGTTIVICGDTPLITPETLETLIKKHKELNAKATILTAIAPDPTGYGRIIRNAEGTVNKIVEHKDCNEAEILIKEINTGTFCFDNELLFEALKNVTNENSQGEYYLTDVIELLRKQGEIVAAYCSPYFEETLGINDRIALAQAEKSMQRRINEKHMKNGVTIIDPSNTYIHVGVTIGKDTAVYPGCVITGNTAIGEECTIGPNSEIHECRIGNKTDIKHSAIYESEIGDEVNVGPFAHIRPNSKLSNKVKIGNFVEVKKSSIDCNSKVNHLSYIGDAKIGSDVNVGCGTITVNYDGKNKHVTTIEDNSFIGCNSNLVAPVTVGKGAYVAAGSTITKDVPSEALAVARAQQVIKENYAKKMNHRK